MYVIIGRGGLLEGDFSDRDSATSDSSMDSLLELSLDTSSSSNTDSSDDENIQTKG